jgi:hypothetical protein
MNARSAAVAAVVVAVLAASARPQVDALYSVSAADGNLRSITLVYASTVGVTPIVRDTGGDATQVRGLTRDAGTGTAYALVTFAGGPAQHFCRLDLNTGVATSVAPVNAAFTALACAEDGTVFTIEVASATSPAVLHTIEPATGASAVVVALAADSDGEALAMAPDKWLYRVSGHAGNVGDSFERIDPTSGERTPLTLSGDDYDGFTVLCVYTGRYLLAVDHASQLHVVTTAGHVRHFGGLDHGAVTGLVFVPSGDEAPFFRQYGDGCATTTGAMPMLAGCGHASGGHNPGVHLRYSPPGALGVLAIGAGDGVLPFPSAACPTHVEPIFATLGFVADSLGDFNTWFPLPAGTAPTDVYFQIAVLEGTELVVSNAVRMHVQ